MFRAGIVVLAVALAPCVSAAAAQWGQCGGIEWTGDTACVSGTTCTVLNPEYSQCLAGSSTADSSRSAAVASTSATEFVKVSGQRFTLNGATYPLVGANAYWVGLMGYSTSDMHKAFADIAGTGATTVRTWGFNDVTTASGIYYQLWENGKATVNTGATGLQNFDNVVAAAKANGIRLIVALTNNWSDYGGMDVYVSQIANSANHDLFYSDPAVQAAFKTYVQTFVTRYRDEPTILAWELANEPRCRGSTGSTTGSCKTTTITQWATIMSAFIKSIDPNHLVGIGDEGFYNRPGSLTYPYWGTEGIDFDANLKIDSIDFGTMHLYPITWGQIFTPIGWGTQWIKDHQASGAAVNKPVILEEFGVTSNQVATYTTWYNAILSSNLTGDLIWQAGSYLSSTTPNDGFTVYPDGPVYPLEAAHAAALKARG